MYKHFSCTAEVASRARARHTRDEMNACLLVSLFALLGRCGFGFSDVDLEREDQLVLPDLEHDENKDGKRSFVEVVSFLRSLGEDNDSDLKKLFMVFDTDRDGYW
jgi:hypothetical protein